METSVLCILTINRSLTYTRNPTSMLGKLVGWSAWLNCTWTLFTVLGLRTCLLMCCQGMGSMWSMGHRHVHGTVWLMQLLLVLLGSGWVWWHHTWTLMCALLRLWRACREVTHWLRSHVTSVARPMLTSGKLPRSCALFTHVWFVSISGVALHQCRVTHWPLWDASWKVPICMLPRCR